MACPRGVSGSIISLSLGVAINVLTWICAAFSHTLIQGVLPQLHGFEDGFLVFAGEAHVQGAVSESMSSYLGSSALQNGVKIDFADNLWSWHKPGLPDGGIWFDQNRPGIVSAPPLHR
jgi:hypothetical protein